MDVFDKASKGVGDLLAKARERERVRLEDRLKQLDRVDSHARTLLEFGKSRPGYGWDRECDKSRLEMLSATAILDDMDLDSAVDALCSIEIPPYTEDVVPKAELDAAFRVVIKRLAVLRRETLADE